MTAQARRLENTWLARRIASLNVLVVTSLFLGWRIGRYGNTFDHIPTLANVTFFIALATWLVAIRAAPFKFQRSREE